MPRYIRWVPTTPEYMDTFFELAPVSPDDTVFDLGSGDGRLVFAAAQKGAKKCVGIDIDPDLVNAAKDAAKSKGSDGKVDFIEADVLSIDLSPASIIFCYLFPTASADLRPKFEKELKPGTRVVMESFPVPGWVPVKVVQVNNRRFYLYNMPVQTSHEYDFAHIEAYYREIFNKPVDTYFEDYLNTI